jgi:pimeloyl-ACP methyl ester carboxylesterase
MIEDISPGLQNVTVPVTVIVVDRDQVEREASLRQVFSQFMPQAKFEVLNGVGHLSPLEAPDRLTAICIGASEAT